MNNRIISLKLMFYRIGPIYFNLEVASLNNLRLLYGISQCILCLKLFTVQLNLLYLCTLFEYKFCIYNDQLHKLLLYIRKNMNGKVFILRNILSNTFSGFQLCIFTFFQLFREFYLLLKQVDILRLSSLLALYISDYTIMESVPE